MTCFACLLWAGHAIAQAGFRWNEETGFRWTALAVPEIGHPGFTLVQPAVTGVNFTNVLSESSSAANRVLENGSGVAAGDIDSDGYPDIFFCSLSGTNFLFRNLGGWKFEEITARAGIEPVSVPCRGAVFADINGDSQPDLLISTLNQGVLCKLNLGQGKFAPGPGTALTPNLGSMTLALADIDGNGTLDLYVANYRANDIRDRSRIPIQRFRGQVSVVPELQGRLLLTQDGLFEFGEADQLYTNDGHGQFAPVSWTSGSFLDENGHPLTRAPGDWGLSATFRDVNNDSSPDLYVCNDYWTPDRLWINTGQGRFRAAERKVIPHTSENSMGADFADLDRDGSVDFIVLDMLSRDPQRRRRQALAQARVKPLRPSEGRPQYMRNTLFHNRGDHTFEDIADFAGLNASDWAWQPVFVDVDLDGYEDLIISAGHTRDVQDLDATQRIRSLQHPWPKDITPDAHQAAFTREMADHARLYPPSDAPIITFRNLGNLKFEEVTAQWGTAALGVHQGIAFADFDLDGDLDFVVNNLNGNASLYRNDSSAPRIAVRLKGTPPNTAGIGAKVILSGGALPAQSQEVVSGGRYLSGSEPLLTFAGGDLLAVLTLTVRWRNGQESVLSGIRPNRLYEVDQPQTQLARALGSKTDGPATTPAQVTLFQDTSGRLDHLHVARTFDDFSREPLLPRKLSDLGPALAWCDLNADGHDDLIVGGGQGASLTVFQGDGQGRLQRLVRSSPGPSGALKPAGLVVFETAAGKPRVLAGLANPEGRVQSVVQQFDANGDLVHSAFPQDKVSIGPLALGDVDGDGSLELFVGGHFLTGRYPEPVASRLLRHEETGWKLDVDNSRALSNAGLVAGAVWSDLDGDGLPELVLACEWAPLRVFLNHAGHLKDATAEFQLQPYTGLWSAVTAADVNEDGKLDLIAGNWGLNSPYRASPRAPLRLYFGDLLHRGVIDVVEAEFDPARRVYSPMHRLDFMARGLPFLRERFPTHRAFSEASIEEIFADNLSRVSRLECTTLESCVFINRGDHFEPVPLPREAQMAPVFALSVADFDGDGHEDLFLGQNFFGMHWEMPPQDAGRGLILRGDGSGHFSPVPGQRSGVEVYGEQRSAATADFDEDGRVDLAVSQHNGPTRLFRNQSGLPGLRVRLRGPKANPLGIGVVLQWSPGLGPAREVHGGSGHWSQDSAVQVLARHAQTGSILARWPGGVRTITPVQPDTSEVLIDFHSAPRLE